MTKEQGRAHLTKINRSTTPGLLSDCSQALDDRQSTPVIFQNNPAQSGKSSFVITCKIDPIPLIGKAFAIWAEAFQTRRNPVKFVQQHRIQTVLDHLNQTLSLTHW